MLRIAKYLKPFIGLISLAIVFLFVQAMAELALPDYMSDIVNTGIQQGGIEQPVPEAIRAGQMDKLLHFMNEREKEQVMQGYMRIDRAHPEYADYVERFPALAAEAIYVLKDDADREGITSMMGISILALANVQSTGAFDFTGEQAALIREQIEVQFSVLGEKMITQSAAAVLKTEYEALGLDTDKIQNRYIIKIGLKMLAISLLSAAAIVIVGFLSARTAAGLARNLRKAVFAKVESFSKAEIDQFSTASLITRTTNDITQIQMLLVMLIRMVFYAPIIGIGGIIKALEKSNSMSWIIAVAVIALIILVITVFITALPKFKIIQKLTDRLNLVTRENLSGMMVIRAFNTQEFEERRFDQANAELTRTNLFINRVMAVMFPTMMLIMNAIVLLIVWVGAKHIANAEMQVGDMMAFMQYAMQIIFAFLMMSFMFIMIPRAAVSAQRIAEVLDTESQIHDPEETQEFVAEKRGIVEFRNVSFRYPGAEKDVLKDISFTALPGQTTAIIGSTGSGKSTLVNLILRFYDATSGQVLVDGVDVRQVKQHALREKIGYVPQTSSLFSGTIESNLKYAAESATEEELKRVAEISQALEFIENKPEQFRSEVAQGGTNLSGGQKQRLSIARALMKKADIYIFDDSFSALDFKTYAKLRDALYENLASKTVIIVAQRISAIMNAEQIIVLEEGRIIGKGTHRELMENCETYREIAFSQHSKEELA